ncbi:hypothetical protein [Aromatoleum sp.]|uniref:hypothetical protein n=1 Tax=Aromatoleum sp. TaxID=2307007 RepID=UPI002FC94F2C
MPCSVYCLVSRAEEVQRAMERLAAAGVPNEEVTVIFRAGDSWLARDAREVSFLASPSVWSGPFTSLSLWWALASVGFGAPTTTAQKKRRSSVVVPSTVFEARRLRRPAS